MIISVASGKGGTGKTTIAINLALSLDNVQFLDCDVEEPNAHIFLKPDIKSRIPVYVPVPVVDESICDTCGRCRQVCAYNAIVVIPSEKERKGSVLIFPNLCHGCGACFMLCPRRAIKEVNKEIGVVEKGVSGKIDFIHGRLDIGQAMSPPLIRQVQEHIDPQKNVIIDAPPGTSCPVIAAIKKSDYCILVTEPTPFGLNDLALAIDVLRKLDIPFGVVINRSDIGDNRVEDHCNNEKIPVLLKIPFSRDIALAYSRGTPLVVMMPEYSEKFRKMFTGIKEAVGKEQ